MLGVHFEIDEASTVLEEVILAVCDECLLLDLDA